MTHAANNPFFGKFKTPFETPPFDKIKIEHYEPAFDEGIKQMEKEVQEIANNPQPATFENTVVALERSGKLLETVSSVFFNVLGAEANDEMCIKRNRSNFHAGVYDHAKRGRTAF